MKKLLMFLMAICLSVAVVAQDLKPVAKKIYEKKQRQEEFVPVTLFDLSELPQPKLNELTNVVSDATVLEFRKNSVQNILITRPGNINLIIPTANGNVEMELFQSNIFTPDFSVTSSGNNGKAVAYQGGLHYWGIVKGDNASLAAISIYDNEVMGLITSPLFGNLVLGKLENDLKGNHIFYNDKKLKVQPNIECSTINDQITYESKQLQNANRVMANCIRLFWEVNYDIFQNKGSVTNAANYVIGLFNQSAIIYGNDAIPVELSEVYVWNTASPYTSSTTSGQLGIFQSTRNSINGDLGHLLGLTGGGGVAAGFSGICNANLDASQCYSMIYSTYSNVPTYSWSVMVVTHEQGHLVGSRHTHACVWNGNNTAIDGCGPAAGYGYEGTCSGAPIPSGGGTIMSYCHLNAVGINLSLGFGTQPKNAIINNFNNGACLSACIGTACMPSANMATASILSATATFNWDAATGATGYNIRYRIIGSGTWITATAATNTYNASGLTPGSNYEWQVQTVCSGGSSIFTISTNFTTQPLTCLSPTNLSTTNITSTSATFNWATASGATSYTIQYRIVGAGSWSTTTSSGTSVNVFSLTPSSNYEWQIQTSCSGGGTSSFSSSVNFNTPAPPCNIPQNNFTTNVTDVVATLNWGSPGGGSGSSYNLRYRIVGNATWITTSATLSPLAISALIPLSNYEWQVQTVCGLTTSSFSNSILFTTLCSTPSANITVNGATTFCLGGSVLLTTNSGAGYTYQWALNGVPIPGSTLSSYVAANSGNYSVVVTSGTCSATSVATTVTANPLPGVSISGPTSFCAGNTATLNAGATFNSYAWSTGATTQSINVNTAGIFTLTITDVNGCTGSATVTTTVNANPAPGISGATTFCAGNSTTLDAGTGYSAYNWSTGATTQSVSVNTAGTYTVTVTNANGCAGSASASVSEGSQTATITPGGPTTICSGGVLLNANTGAGLTYQWKNGGADIPGAIAASYTATTSGSYTVVVAATGGCSTTSSATVVTIGALTAAITPSGSVAVCSGSSTTLSATTGTGYSYQWYRNNVLLSAITSTFTTATQGTYKCAVTSGTCTSTTNSVVVSVISNPSATVTYTSPLAFCAPGSVTLTANTFSGVTYLWEKNNVAIAGATAQTYIATTAGAYRVKETKSGCSSYSSAKTVTAATSVTAAISTNDPTTLCAGGTVNMAVSTAIPGYTYQWKNNNVNIPGATATTYPATASGSYTVIATASCGTATSNTIVVNIGTFSAEVTPAGNATLCTGGSLTLSANAGTGFTYQWKNNNVNIIGATAATLNVTTAGSYSVAITSPCGSATSVATVVTQTTVTASVTPAGSNTICSGTSITLTANAGTGYTYKWYRNNVLLTATTQTFTTSTAGSYKVEVSISGSCAVQSNTATITVINNPTPTVTAGGPTTFCAGQNVLFTANTYAGVTHQWQKNSVNIAGATNQSYTATTAGSYRVQQTANGCTKNSSQKTVIVNCRLGNNGEEVSSDEINSTTMEVYPNPFADKVNIQITSPVTEQTEIKVIDVLGKEQYSQMITTNRVTELSTQLPAGVYMINAFVDGQTKVARVVKTK